jgi:outer membrane protein assembly factor BamB/tRNA A-37 threonylcarbamoyl transferase component Bud32
LRGGNHLETQPINQDLETNPAGHATQQLQPGITLSNRYLIQGIIGIGGMSAVYRARDLHFPNVEKKVAVKEMVNSARDPVVKDSIVRNFEREANLLATLNHPAIPRIYDYFSQNERSYLILEFIEGKDLDAILKETVEVIPEDLVVNWAIELCDVLNYLHTHKPDPIIFRDIKPSNIMVNLSQHIVLVDFGIAKPFQVGPKGTMIGTEGYSPPEQYRGEATPLADIYALGATLHHVLTRKDPGIEAPFSFDERPIRQINPGVSAELEAIIYKAVQYNPENRFKSALDMREALRGVAALFRNHSKGPSEGTSNAQVENDKKPLWTFECEDEIRGAPNLSDGAILVGCYDNNLYALNASTGKFVWKYATEGGVVSKPAVFEGEVYFGSSDNRLYVVSLSNGKLTWTYPTEESIHSSPTLSEGHVFIGSDDNYLHAVNAFTGKRAWRYEAGSAVRSTPLVQQETVFFGTEGGDFFALDITGSLRWRHRSKRAVTSSPVSAQGLIYFGSVDWTVYALEVKSGWVVWKFRTGKATISTPCISGNYIYTGSTDGSIYCLDMHNGKKIWQYTTENQVTGSPIIYKESIYCGSVDGYMYCLDSRTGRLKWKFRTDGPITGTPIAGNDILYIGSLDRRMYALAV